MEQKTPYMQKVFRATLRFQGSTLHTMPLEVTRAEMKLLAHIHGASALPANEISYIGERELTESKVDDDGILKVFKVANEMGEYKRLARKYSSSGDLAQADRGRKLVESCFGVKLEDFDVILDAVDPVTAAEEAMARAEIEALQKAEANRMLEVPPEAAKPPPIPTFGIGNAAAAG